MNFSKLKEIIRVYKEHFQLVHYYEINKWKATKHFQENWNPDAPDYSIMLENALKNSKNLLDSGSYFPKKMLSHYVQVSPLDVKFLFENLFNEELDLFYRMDMFKKGIDKIHQKHFGQVKNTYQDDRAIIFYLCMMYPERYYLYKFKMVKDFYKLIDYPNIPKRGQKQNILHYFSVCDIVNQEIIKDDELIKLHHSRLAADHYQDPSLHLLTQDIIFAADRFLKDYLQTSPEENIVLIDTEMDMDPSVININLSGVFINQTEREKENKKIGDIGELFILEYEQRKVLNFGISKKPTHDAKDIGDGIGYDILSFDEKGEKKFIEVKTTRGKKNTPFYLTINELVKSKKEKENYYLYRIYDLEEESKKAKLYIINGDLDRFCINPVKYKIALQKKL